MNVFDLRGPDFLLFYLALLVVGELSLFVARRVLRRSSVSQPVPPLDAYETAYLAGGASRVTLLALASLADRQAVTLSGRQLTFRGSPGGPRVHAIERALLAARPATTSAARRAIAMPIEAIHRSLESAGLIADAGSRSLYRAFAAALGLCFLGIGAVKISVGLDRHRPVEFLVMIVIAVFVRTLVAIARPPHRSSAGESEYRRLRDGTERSPTLASGSLASARAGDVALVAVALWGLPALSSHPMYAQFRAVAGPSEGGSSDSGGGGGDGGGGCGGGGCGGCGGGD